MDATAPTQAPTQEQPIPVTKEQIEALRQCISDTIASYRAKRKRNKIGAIIAQILTISSSFGTTVLIGWKIAQEPASGTEAVSTINAALVISALATGITALDKFFDYKALWINYNVSIANLKAALSKLEFLAALGLERIKQSQLEEIFNRYEFVCNNMNETYQQIRSAKEE